MDKVEGSVRQGSCCRQDDGARNGDGTGNGTGSWNGDSARSGNGTGNDDGSWNGDSAKNGDGTERHRSVEQLQRLLELEKASGNVAEKCMKCGRELTHNEIGLHKKMFNRGAEQFYCINCCAEYFEVSREMLEKKIVQFKEMGCTLFE